MVPQDVETDRAIRVDVRVVNLGREADLGGFEGVVCGERDRQEEDAAGVRRVTLKSQHESHEPLKERNTAYRAHNRCLPLEHVIACGSGAA